MASSSFKNSGDFLRCEICNNRCIPTLSAQYNKKKWYCSRCSGEDRSTYDYPKLYSELQDKRLLLPRSKSQTGVCTNLMKSIEGGSRKKMFPDLTVNKKSCTTKSSYGDFQFRGSLMTLSKKPVHCPYIRCNRTIAVSSVHSHFKYEHKHVPVLSTTLGARNELELDPYTLEINHPTCIVLITFPQKHEKGAADRDENALTPTMLLMASNIMNNQLTRGNDDDDDSDDGLAPFDKIIFWICSNVLTPSKCTLAISTICKSIRIKYYGPTSQINDSYIKLYQEGKGLILHQLQILNMTNYGKKRLAIDVIIHKEQ